MKTRNSTLLGGIVLLAALSTLPINASPISSSGSATPSNLIAIRPGGIILPPLVLNEVATGFGLIPAPATVQPWAQFPYPQPPNTMGHFAFSATQPGPAPAVGSGTVTFWVAAPGWPRFSRPVLLRIDGTFTASIWPRGSDGGLVEGSGPAVLSRPGFPPIKGAVTITADDFDPSPSNPTATGGDFEIQFWLVSSAGYFTEPIYHAGGSVPDSPFGNVEIGF